MGTITDDPEISTIYEPINAVKYAKYPLGISTLPRWRAKAVMTGLARQIQQALEGRRVIEVEEIKAEENPQSIDWVIVRSSDGFIDGYISSHKQTEARRARVEARISFYSTNESDRADYDLVNPIVQLYLGKPKR